jgi:HAD superfamily hydrolase (TIGR01549 family)
MMVKAVVFDVGECLVDETHEYHAWADWLGVPRHTFSAVFGAVIARGLDYRETFQVLSPGFDLSVERVKRAEAGQPEYFGDDDLYLDVRPSLSALQAAGLWIGIAGNQTARAGGILRSLDLPADMIATSDDLHIEKPDPGFFAAIERAAPVMANEILYVGDRLDNDIVPAHAHGFQTALIRRGPWGVTQQHDPIANTVATMRIDSLAQLPGKIVEINSAIR